MKNIEFDIDTHTVIDFITSNIAGDKNRIRVCQELAALATLLWNEEKKPIIRLVDEPSLHHVLRQQRDAK